MALCGCDKPICENLVKYICTRFHASLDSSAPLQIRPSAREFQDYVLSFSDSALKRNQTICTIHTGKLRFIYFQLNLRRVQCYSVKFIPIAIV